MPDGYLQLSYWQVGLAVGLIVINAGISVGFALGLEKRLLIGSVRTVVQLMLIGWVLQWIFANPLWYVVVPIMLTMAVIAGTSAVGRSSRVYPGIYYDSVLSVMASAVVVLSIAVVGIFHIEPWYAPRHALPILGIILGNALNGISLGLRQFSDDLATHRQQVEMLFTLGATRWEAARPFVRKAIQTGMVPIINSMMVVGLVSLPGIMTGQVLSGVDPMEAVKYQIVVMFLIASGAAMGTVGVVVLCYRRLFTADHQFLYERLRKRTDMT